MGRASREKRERRADGSNRSSPAVQRRTANAAAQQFSPGALAVNERELEQLLAGMPAERLPYLGLSMFYLAQTPVRHANQCLLASTVLMIALHSFDVKADLVALEITIPAAGVLYGSPTPQFENGTLRGHVGLLAEDTFIDATAAQFDAIRKDKGVVPIVSRVKDAAKLREEGGNVPFTLGKSGAMFYHVHPVGSADSVGVEFARMQPENEVTRQVTNLVRGFAWGISQLRGNVDTGLPKLNQMIATASLAASEGKNLKVEEGVMQYR